MRKPEHFFWMTSFHRVLQSFGVTSDKFNIVKMWKSKKFLKKDDNDNSNNTTYNSNLYVTHL
jgi:hypothetical protein